MTTPPATTNQPKPAGQPAATCDLATVGGPTANTANN